MKRTQRRKLIQSILILFGIMLAGFVGRLIFLDQSIPSLLLGRKPGTAASGTQLVKEEPIAPEPLSSSNTVKHSISSTSHSPIPLKFQTLGGWKFIEKKTPIPDKVKNLDGKWVEAVGFMLPISEVQNIKNFILIQSLWGCCFGQAPEPNHVILVKMEPGRTAEFYPDPVKVVGRFSIQETREEGELISIYQLDASSVLVK